MTARRAEILLDVTGQVFTFDVPEGRPSASPAPTCTVYSTDVDDDGTPESATTGSVSIDAVNTSLDAEATEGSSVLVLSSNVGVARGRRYMLGGLEQVEVLYIDEDDNVHLRRPLLNTHAEDAPFVGTRLSISVDSTFVADDDNLTDSTLDAGYRLRWSYTVDGVPHVGVSFADVVRYPTQDVVSALDVDDRYPGFIDRLPADHRDDQGAALMRSAHDAVRADMLGDAQAMRRIRDTAVVGELVKCRAMVIAIQFQILAGAANMTDALKVARDEYDQRYQQLIREPKVPADPSGEGASAPAKRLPIWVR